MKIARYDAGTGPRAGVIKGDAIIDLEKSGFRYHRVIDIIAAGTTALEELSELMARSEGHHDLKNVTLLAPVERTGKYLGIGMNYKKHAEEAAKLGVAKANHQVWFNKQTSCISGPFDAIDPGVTEKLDYEVELGVVIGKSAKGVDRNNAMSHIFGYFVANDVSARDWQFHSPTFTMGKSFDTHGPIGPWITTADEISDPQNLDLKCTVNGEMRQSSNTSQMVHLIVDQIAYLSTAFTLEPGDLLATGTPEGVGVAMDPPVFLQPGDVVRCEIEGLGVIENTVTAG